jgi:hypothetical protein
MVHETLTSLKIGTAILLAVMDLGSLSCAYADDLHITN